jgi:hypothetical protein
MATKTYGTTGGNNIAYVTSADRAIISSFTPDDWGGNTNPQEGRALYTVTKITVYAKKGDADSGDNGVNVVMGSTTGSFNKARTRAYSTYDGSSQLGSSYKYMAATVSAVLGSTSDYYGGLEALGPAGAYTLRGASSGETTYVVAPSTGSVTYSWSGYQQYLSLEYYGLPNAPSSLSATTTGQNSVSLFWGSVSASGVATGADGYDVQYKASSSSTWISFTTTTSTSTSVTGLSAGTAYDFRVAAYDSTIRNVVSGSTGPWSSTASATTESDTPPVPAPTWSGSFNSGQINTGYVQDSARAAGHDTAYGNIYISSGSLPPGLSGSASGEYYYVSGTPTSSGTYTFTLRAENDGGPAEQQFSIYIASLPAPSWIDQTLATTATIGVSYSDSVSASNVTSWSYSGTLPAGLIFSNGSLGGTPTTAGVYVFTIYASNTSGTTEKTFTITVESALLNGGYRMTGPSSSTQLTTFKRYNGSSWVDLTVAKRYNGSSWEDI